jgi:glycosyltransferase involved in cell wall biosynthesis
MTIEKGIDLLGRIAAGLPPAVADRTRLVLLGGVSAGHTLIGSVSAYRAGFVDEVYPAMAGLDVLWHPATSEGLGTAVIDAMALRVPPIAFRVGGLPELIVDGQTGILVPAGDVEAFSRAAGTLVQDEGLRRRLGDAGPDRSSHFSVAKMVEGTERAYEKARRAAKRATRGRSGEWGVGR